ncbi:phospholipid:diacylglycerol acyltransferase 1-like [Senna tora]|uniref:phospholipid:diacylglycerol acyltransferase n=1 Tax=Senna tora TaxID=362788 RepID=A0A835CD04_9FABA|nr:phospholipid:diacylglycerol acyltransferase 1-like [Senna tora]
MSFLRHRKASVCPTPPDSDHKVGNHDEKGKEEKEKEVDTVKRKRKDDKIRKWSCVDRCCWFIGCTCSMWWFLLFLCNVMPASFPQYVAEAIGGPLQDPPGVKLRKEGLVPKHPVVFVPGIVTSGLELWEGRQCAEGSFRKRMWGGTFGELFKRPLCWVEHMTLDNSTGLDRLGIRVRPVSGLLAADYFALGYFVWAVLIANLAHIGYEEKTMYMASYDWRISFQNTEVRDQTLSRMKSNIELMVATNGGNKVVVIPHSMGVLYFLHFMKWVEAPAPMGGGGGSDWCAKHIKAIVNIGGPFLGVPKSVAGLFSMEARDIAAVRAIAPGFLDKDVFGLQTLQHIMRMTRTWDTTMSMMPKGGDTIWGGLDWSPEGYYNCNPKKKKHNDTHKAFRNGRESFLLMKNVNYGRLISFGKDAAELDSSKLGRLDFKSTPRDRNLANTSNCDIWTEYCEMGVEGINSVADYKAYTADSILDLLHYIAPKMMKRGDAQFSHGIADNLDDLKYKHYRYWSNPLETTLPNAPEMEIYSMYGVGIPTERAYVYKLTPPSECYIPFQIDSSVDGGNEDSCLKGGVYFVDGDETVPTLSAGFMCAKGWRGRTRFNPSGSPTYIREYNHAPPANLLEGRGTQSGAHVDILGNFALIEDILRVAAGATGADLGGDRVYSDIFKLSEMINLKL